MDELYEKTEALLKSLLSIKTGASKDLMVPAIKPPAPKLPKPPSIKQPSMNKIPSGLPPPSKKDPVKVAEQLKNPNPGKVKVEVLKVESNGQWSLEKGNVDPSHGISFVHEHHDLGGVGDLTHVKAVHPKAGVVGEAMFQHQPDGTLQFTDVTTHPDWRRKGIATGITQHAMSVTGKMIGSHTGMTDAGAAFKQGAITQNPEKVSLKKGVDSLEPQLSISLPDEVVSKIKEHQEGCQYCMMSGPQNCTKRRKLIESHLPQKD